MNAKIYLQETVGKYSNLTTREEYAVIQPGDVLRLIEKEWDIVERCWKYVFSHEC